MNAIIKELSHDETLMVNGGEKTYYGVHCQKLYVWGTRKHSGIRFLNIFNRCLVLIGAQNIIVDLDLTKGHL